MYQTVGTNATLAISEALERPLYRRPIIGKPKIKTLEYALEEGDEVEDLELLVKDVLVANYRFRKSILRLMRYQVEPYSRPTKNSGFRTCIFLMMKLQ